MPSDIATTDDRELEVLDEKLDVLEETIRAFARALGINLRPQLMLVQDGDD